MKTKYGLKSIKYIYATALLFSIFSVQSSDTSITKLVAAGFATIAGLAIGHQILSKKDEFGINGYQKLFRKSHTELNLPQQPHNTPENPQDSSNDEYPDPACSDIW